MSKAFTRETEGDEDALTEPEGMGGLPLGARNYMTPHGHRRLLDELRWLVNEERPQVTNVVSWAARNGDRSENGDYLYGKRRLREIDRRVRYLTRRIEQAEVVDPASREATDQVFFGATVTYQGSAGDVHTIRIVGVDEMDLSRGYVTWISPLARALLKAREGDSVTFQAPGGRDTLEVIEVAYREIRMDPFVPVRSGWAPNAR
jgi:transcription elongation factor GreB